jgi:hypothetical protein
VFDALVDALDTIEGVTTPVPEAAPVGA